MLSQDSKQRLLRFAPQRDRVRRPRLVGVREPGDVGDRPGRGRGDGPVPAVGQHPGARRRRRRRRARLRPDRPPRRRRAPSARLLRRPGKDRGDVRGRRRPALRDRRRPRRGRCRRRHQADRPRLVVDQHGRGEGVPGGGRGGAQAGRLACATPPSSACPTTASASGSSPSSNRRAARTVDEAHADRPRQGPPRLVQGAARDRRRRFARPWAERQARPSPPPRDRHRWTTPAR